MEDWEDELSQCRTQEPSEAAEDAESTEKIGLWKILIPILLTAVILGGALYYFVLRTPSAKAISFAREELNLAQGEVCYLSVSIEPYDAGDALTWESSDTGVASVESGRITALAEGTCTITARISGKTASCTVTVTSGFTGEEEAIVGNWCFDGAYMDGKYVSESKSYLLLYNSKLGELVREGEEPIEFHWSFSDSAEGISYYTAVTDDGVSYDMSYYSDPDNSYFGELTFWIDHENMIFFAQQEEAK